MIYKGYKLTEEKDRLIVENVRDFDPIHIFECGQCFRWVRQEDHSYVGVVGGKAIRLHYDRGVLKLIHSSAKDFIDLWYEYFDLGRDYLDIKQKLSKDDIMRKAIEFGRGMRILKQNSWEMIISFIISSNNRIPRIINIIDAISKVYGEEIEFEGQVRYSFPGLEKLSCTSIEDLDFCKSGYRCKYIVETSKMLKSGVVSADRLFGRSTEEARNELMKLSGVGPKVADCILLFSGIKQDVFPTDVWVKRVMEELYFGRETSLKEIQEFIKDYFGELAGFAQQYLFYYARENKIGTKT